MVVEVVDKIQIYQDHLVLLEMQTLVAEVVVHQDHQVDLIV